MTDHYPSKGKTCIECNKMNPTPNIVKLNMCMKQINVCGCVLDILIFYLQFLQDNDIK